ncbi:glutamate racemase [Methylomonas sp. MgM2]
MHSFAAESAPIGVLDSGVGGLSILRALRAKMPEESFIYVSDGANAPYGDKSTEFVLERAKEVAAFLLQKQAKAMVLACNTASVISAQALRSLHSLPIVAMEPAIKPAAAITKAKIVLVLATTNTIRSESVARLCEAYARGVRVILQPCPGLADLVEIGRLDHDATHAMLEKYIRPGLVAGADTIVLGCTHYAFLADSIARIAGPAVTIIEPSEAIARQLHRILPAAVSSLSKPTATTFYSTGSLEGLSAFLAAAGEPHAQVCRLPTCQRDISTG